MKKIPYSLLTKYAVLLSLFFAIEYLVARHLINLLVDFQLMEDGTPAEEAILRSVIPSALVVLLNLITTLLVFIDMRALNIPTRYVIISTLMYRYVGVFAFIMFTIIHDQSEAQQRVDPSDDLILND